MSFKANLKDGDGNKMIGYTMKDNEGKVNFTSATDRLLKVLVNKDGSKTKVINSKQSVSKPKYGFG